MKLQRHLAREVGGKEYYKWVITIPPKHVEALGWKEGDELESRVNKGSLIIKKADLSKRHPKMTYEEFRDKIAELLKREPQGLNWTEIKKRLNLPQKVPNNLWVRMMENDIGLIRKLDSRTGKVIWRLKEYAKTDEA